MSQDYYRQSFFTVVCCVAWVGLASLVDIVRADDAFREWTDASGKHKTEAQLIEIGADTVKLRKRDGEERTVAIAKLSTVDQEYISKKEIAKSKLLPGPSGPTELKPARTDEATVAAVDILILREINFAGAPVKDEKDWYDAELAKLAYLDRGEFLRDAVRNLLGITDANFVDKAESIAQLFASEPKLEYLVLVYVNSASLRCQVNGLTDNMMVRRKNGSSELIMHPKHRDYGHNAPPRATNIFYDNYSGAVAAVFRRGEKTPLAYEFALAQNQSLNLPKDPDFPALIKTVLAKPAVTRALASVVKTETHPTEK